MSYTSDSFGTRRDVAVRVTRSRSGLAVAGLACSPLFFLPLLPLAGALLGAKAISQMRSDASKTGRGLAKTAVGIGLVLTLAQAYAGFQAWAFQQAYTQGPRQALSGNYADLIAELSAGAESSKDAKRFMGELQQRYGSLTNVEPMIGPIAWQRGEPARYRLTFERGAVIADVGMTPEFSLGTMSIEIDMRSVRLHDQERGDLAFPPTGPAAFAGVEETP